jgi:hypothetical protein
LPDAAVADGRRDFRCYWPPCGARPESPPRTAPPPPVFGFAEVSGLSVGPLRVPPPLVTARFDGDDAERLVLEPDDALLRVVIGAWPESPPRCSVRAPVLGLVEVFGFCVMGWWAPPPLEALLRVPVPLRSRRELFLLSRALLRSDPLDALGPRFLMQFSYADACSPLQRAALVECGAPTGLFTVLGLSVGDCTFDRGSAFESPIWAAALCASASPRATALIAAASFPAGLFIFIPFKAPGLMTSVRTT